MEQEKVNELSGFLAPPPCNVVAMAINGGKRSKHVIRWAMDNFFSDENTTFKLLHVRRTTTHVPTSFMAYYQNWLLSPNHIAASLTPDAPLHTTPEGFTFGNSIPILHVRDDVAAAYIKEMDWKTNEMLSPYKNFFSQKKVEVDIVIIESDNVPTALAKEVAKDCTKKLIIGATSSSIFSWSTDRILSSKIIDRVPKFCSVYAVSKGKLVTSRPSDSDYKQSIKDDNSDTWSTHSSSSNNSSSQTDPGLAVSSSPKSAISLPMQRFQESPRMNQILLHNRTDSNVNNNNNNSRNKFLIIKDGEDVTNNSDNAAPISRDSSSRSFEFDSQSRFSDPFFSTPRAPVHSYSDSQQSSCFDLDKINTELHGRGFYPVMQSEPMDASRKYHEINKRRLEAEAMLKEINIKEEVLRQEIKKQEDAMKEAEYAEKEAIQKREDEKEAIQKREAKYMRECAEREAMQRKEAEMKVREIEKLESALVEPTQNFIQFKWEEIVDGTSSFSENLRIGMGSYGTVYKCQLNHITTAVKVLHSREANSTKQFQQELDVLSRIRHPHLLMLIGSCPEQGSLVYEYMENGSLEERLLRKHKTKTPIPWFDRFRIAYEVATALIFLHNAKPKPIIHRDLKPANILLDHNLVSKIGDVGLSKMLQIGPSAISTTYKDTGLVGTMCYVDPEYQRTGVNSPKSDVYAYGMVVLQLLIATSAKAITHVVENAIEDGLLMEILDQEAGEWPMEETKELAIVGLGCAELRRRDRPDLKEHVMPILERLKAFSDKARDEAYSVLSPPPSHFICPILTEVMAEPCVAADGYTYDRKSIEKWLEIHDTSPMTNMPLPNKNLIPNFTLLSAIMEWKSKK